MAPKNDGWKALKPQSPAVVATAGSKETGHGGPRLLTKAPPWPPHYWSMINTDCVDILNLAKQCSRFITTKQALLTPQNQVRTHTVLAHNSSILLSALNALRPFFLHSKVAAPKSPH